jgi:hypothetical protein
MRAAIRNAAALKSSRRTRRRRFVSFAAPLQDLRRLRALS